MLWLKNITKNYETSGAEVRALQDVSLGFRDNEFVAILGQSGCGKTTLLNIIGGLDRYTSGDLIINGRSTKQYKDGDWDVYRNHSIGFVFQTYNLIPHQTVLANVELALTLSGVGRAERRKRAVDALEAVGLKDQLNKKPNQMSGGQMQRVAIARALVNNPDILLADEPTGALDTETSVQVMDILKNVARDRLVIMVTHNPELAEQYATRTVRLLDGRIINDSMPVDEAELIRECEAVKAKEKKKQKKTSMSFVTALSLSLNNLMTKKARTILISFAGSIGIIGIALVLSMSSGFQNYINRVQEDTLSTYPITIQSESLDLSGLFSAMAGKSQTSENNDDTPAADKREIHSIDAAGDIYSTLQQQVKSNDLQAFYDYLQSKGENLEDLTSAVRYSYDLDLNVYNTKSPYGIVRVNPSAVPEVIESSYSGIAMFMQSSNMDVWSELIDNSDLLNEQYDVICGHWPENYNEVVLAVNKNNGINVLSLYTLGILDQSKLAEQFEALANAKPYDRENIKISFDDIVCEGDSDAGWRFNLVPNSEFFFKNEDGTFTDRSDDKAYVEERAMAGEEIRVVGIIRPSESAVAGSMNGAIGYTAALTEHLIELVSNGEAFKAQQNDQSIDIFTGKTFISANKLGNDEMASAFREAAKGYTDAEKAEIFKVIDSGSMTAEERKAIISKRLENITEAEQAELTGKIMAKLAQLPQEEKMKLMPELSAMQDPNADPEKKLELIDKLIGDELIAEHALSESELALRFDAYINDESRTSEELAELYKKYCLSQSSYEKNTKALSIVDKSSPKAIYIYPTDFAAKEKISSLISEYNALQTDDEKKINYTDYIGIFISSISTIIDTISYVLIGFVSISLVVSSIMIGVITYISVLERTKEIGILRSIGASKHDIRMVFNAETFIVGSISGLLGIGITLLLIIPINAIINALTGIVGMALLPLLGGIGLVVVSILLTVIAGLIPSGFAAHRDPVVALRTE